MIAALIVSLLVTLAALGMVWVCDRACQATVASVQAFAQAAIDRSKRDEIAANDHRNELLIQLADAERRARRRSRRVSGTTDSRETKND